MRQQQTVRVIKRDQRALCAESAAKAAGAGEGRSAERDLRAVVSGWIREHRQQAESLRRARLPW